MATPVSPSLQAAYDAQYSDASTEWRELGARDKAKHILEVCSGRHFAEVLECGAGEGSLLQALDASHAFKSLTAVEISDSAIGQIRKRHIPSLREVLKFDGYTLPFADRTFDLAYCSHVLEHVEHPRLLLRELKRVSRYQAFEIPLDYTPVVDRNVKHLVGYGHIAVYTPATFRFLLQSEGFEVLSEVRAKPSPDVVRYDLYVMQKRPKTIRTELGLRLLPLRDTLARLRLGPNLYREVAFSTYTCLTEGTGDLRIFGT